MRANQNKAMPGETGMTWPLALLITAWSLEILFVQQITTLPTDHMVFGATVKDAARRLALNLAICTVLVCLFNRFWLYIVFVLGVICSTVLVVCASYMKAPLSWYTIKSQFSEGVLVTDHGLAIVPGSILAVLLGAVLLKTILRELTRRRPMTRQRRRRWAVGGAVAYVLVAIALAGLHKPIHEIKIGSPQYVYGYVVAWISEAIFFDEAAFLEAALTKAAITSDRLTPIEGVLELGQHVAIVQVESLDVAVIETDARGQAVMPFLRALRDRAMIYDVTPFHWTGSSEADFTLLTGAVPNGLIPPFKVRGFPYEDTLARVAREQGYVSIAMHGYSGSFFDRRPAYAQMGFNEILFSEEFEQLGHAVTEDGVEDDAVFQHSASLLREAEGQPTLHFIITFTSHGPFDRLPDGSSDLFPKPADLTEAYLNSMRYVDRALERYYDQLPEGTTLVIYGDHDSQVDGYRDHPPPVERIPWLIARKGVDLAEVQVTRGTPLAQSGALSQLDMATYVRRSLAVSDPTHRIQMAGVNEE